MNVNINDVVYTALFVDDQESLLTQFPPRHGNIFAHHSTNYFKPKSLEGLEMGRKTQLKIIGEVSDDKCYTILVENPKSENTQPHITISCADGVKPFYSNELLEKSDRINIFEKPVYISVTEGYYNKSGEVIL